MEIESATGIAAPPGVVFRFLGQLDHLRYTSARRRQEWCLETGAVLEVGAEYEVRIRQGRHSIVVRFRATRLDPDRCIENTFLSWPLKGAKHTQILEPAEDGKATILRDINHWSPPWYAKSIVATHEEDQRKLFDERLANVRRVVEGVYAQRGEEAFASGIGEDAEAVGFAVVVPLDA